MTATPIHDDEQAEVEAAPVRFSEPTRDTTGDRRAFQIGDDDTVLYATRPKMAVLMQMAGAIDGGPAGAIAAMDAFLTHALDPESRLYLQVRFDDPDDLLDLDCLEEPMQFFLGSWYGRPTGRQAGSQPPASRTGRRSTVRRR